MWSTRTFGPTALLLVSACTAPPASDAGFDSPNPASRIYAITDAARSGDTSATAEIVQLLDSDDPAVRMLAIEALEILTDGETYDYNFDDPPYKRRAAIKRWVDAVESATARGTYGDG